MNKLMNECVNACMHSCHVGHTSRASHTCHVDAPWKLNAHTVISIQCSGPTTEIWKTQKKTFPRIGFLIHRTIGVFQGSILQ